MALLVDDVVKAHEFVMTEARAQGLVVLDAVADAVPRVGVEVVSASEIVAAAVGVGSKLVYVGRSRDLDPELSETIDEALEPEAMDAAGARHPDAPAGAGSEIRESLTRTRTLLREPGFVSFFVGFPHGGVVHEVEIADRVAWLALCAFRELDERDDLDEDDELGDDAVPDLLALAPPLAADAILADIHDSGLSRREARRDATRIVRSVILDNVGDLDALPPADRQRLREAERLAVERLRSGR